MNRAQVIYSTLARAWGPYLGEGPASERAANVAAGAEELEDLDEVMGYFRQALTKVNWAHTTAARQGFDVLERAAWAGLLALVDAGYSFPLDSQ